MIVVLRYEWIIGLLKTVIKNYIVYGWGVRFSWALGSYWVFWVFSRTCEHRLWAVPLMVLPFDERMRNTRWELDVVSMLKVSVPGGKLIVAHSKSTTALVSLIWTWCISSRINCYHCGSRLGVTLTWGWWSLVNALEGWWGSPVWWVSGVRQVVKSDESCWKSRGMRAVGLNSGS